MNLAETCLFAVNQWAKTYSKTPGAIDEYWESVLPEFHDFLANEVFLAQKRRYITEANKQQAKQIAQKAPLRDVSKDSDAVLTLHWWIRRALLGLSHNPEFRKILDQSTRTIVTPSPITRLSQEVDLPELYWVETDSLILPASSMRELKQIFYR